MYRTPLSIFTVEELDNIQGNHRNQKDAIYTKYSRLLDELEKKHPEFKENIREIRAKFIAIYEKNTIGEYSISNPHFMPVELDTTINTYKLTEEAKKIAQDMGIHPKNKAQATLLADEPLHISDSKNNRQALTSIQPLMDEIDTIVSVLEKRINRSLFARLGLHRNKQAELQALKELRQNLIAGGGASRTELYTFIDNAAAKIQKHNHFITTSDRDITRKSNIVQKLEAAANKCITIDSYTPKSRMKHD